MKSKMVLGLWFLLSVNSLSAENLSYSYLDFSYGQNDIHEIGDFLFLNDTDPDGFQLDGSIKIAQNIRLIAGYSDFSGNATGIWPDSGGQQFFEADSGFERRNIGIGYFARLNKNIDWFFDVRYEDVELINDLQFGSMLLDEFVPVGFPFDVDYDSKGLGLQLGVRSLVNSKLELNGSLTYFDLDTDVRINDVDVNEVDPVGSLDFDGRPIRAQVVIGGVYILTDSFALQTKLGYGKASSYSLGLRYNF